MKKILLLFFTLLFFLSPKIVLADCSTSGCSNPTYLCKKVSGNYTCVHPGYTGIKCDLSVEADTALGCIPTQPEKLTKWILKNAILMGGGLAFMLSIWGGATILLSAGNPEKLNEGKQIITSAISGLLFIIFSVFLLRFIGVDILGLPGFSK